jgi:ribosomal protein L40E
MPHRKIVRRDCLDCGAKNGMRLQNVVPAPSVSVPALYVCDRCGTQLTIPPPRSPLVRVPSDA